MSKRYLDNVDSSDLLAFIGRLRLLIADRMGQDIPDAGSAYVDAFADLCCVQLSPKVKSTIQLFADLQDCGLLDKILFGRGTITGKTQPYVLTLDNLTDMDPFCDAVSFLRFRKGNPWFAITREDASKSDGAVRVFERRVRKKKVEISWSPGMRSGDFPTFLWGWFGDTGLPHKSQFGDSITDVDAFREAASKCFENTLSLSDNTSLFEDDNAILLLSFGSIGWMAEFTIKDVFAPHRISDDLFSHTSFKPEALNRVIEKDQQRFRDEGSI